MDFKEWMKENWNTAGGLIPQATAAKILGKTKTRIRQMINEKKLQEYTFDNNTYVSYTEIMQILKNQNGNEELFSQNPEIIHLTPNYIIKIIRQNKPLSQNIIIYKKETQEVITALDKLELYLKQQLELVKESKQKETKAKRPLLYQTGNIDLIEAEENKEEIYFP